MTTTRLSVAVVWDNKVVVGDGVAALLAVWKKLAYGVDMAE